MRFFIIRIKNCIKKLGLLFQFKEDDVEDKNEEIKSFIRELTLSIKHGDGEMAANWSRRLAKLKISLEISLDKKHGSDTIYNEKSTSESELKNLGNTQKEKVKIVIKKNYEQDDQTSDGFVLDLDVSRTKVGQLKEIIEERVASFPSEKQLLIINDCATGSDNEFLSAYKVIGIKRKSRLDQLENGFASACCSSRDQEKFSYEVCVLDKDYANGWEVNEDDSRRKKLVSNI